MPEGDVPFKDYIDAQLAEVRRAVEIAMAASRVEGVPLRQYVEAVLDEQKRALDMAETEREKAASALREQTQRALDKADAEREKAASVLREEQARALVVASNEREKAAQVLREGMTERIAQGDENLKEHIDQQIKQIREALESADRLETARIDSLKAEVHRVDAQASQHVEQLRRERELVTGAQQEAIKKAEDANEKRFEGVNEFRAQLADQTQTFLPREVAEANFTELRKAIGTVTERVNNAVGQDAGRRATEARIQPWSLWAAGAAMTMVVTLIVVLANVLTGS